MSDDMPSGAYGVVGKTVPTFYFVGVTTSRSSIMEVFPRWAEALGRPELVMEGIDHKLHDHPEAYRRTVAQIKHDPLSLGALVTSHKIDLLEAAGDMFDLLHESARLTGEISCISKQDGKLVGHAKDPLTGGMSLDAILGEDYFARTSGHLLCFGAGGSGKAISLHLINKHGGANRPERMVVVNRSQPRLDKLREMVESLQTDIRFEYICNDDPKPNDETMESGDQCHGPGQGPARFSHHGRRPVSSKWNCLGDQLPGRTRILAPGQGPGGRARGTGRRWMAVLPAWLDAAHRGGAARWDRSADLQSSGGDRRPPAPASGISAARRERANLRAYAHRRP